jgi:hypothetical protein
MANKTQEVLYAVVGAGDLAVEKIRDARQRTDRKTTQKFFKDLVKRGQAISKTVRNSGPTKRALAQTKTARAQVKAAATSVQKAVGLNGKAASSAAKSTGSKTTKTAKAS